MCCYNKNFIVDNLYLAVAILQMRAIMAANGSLCMANELGLLYCCQNELLKYLSGNDSTPCIDILRKSYKLKETCKKWFCWQVGREQWQQNGSCNGEHASEMSPLS